MSKDSEEMILEKLARLERLTLLSVKTVLNVDDVADLTGLSKARIYTLCSKREIPHYKQGKAYFKRKELENWLTSNRVMTKDEIESKASLYCHTH